MKLSPRQTEVLECICAQGMTRAETGETLGISEDTVRLHIDKIVAKTGENGKPRRVMFALYRRLYYRPPVATEK